MMFLLHFSASTRP